MNKTEEVPDYCQMLEIRGSDGTVKQLLFPKALDLNRPKRPRTTFSSEQLKRLDAVFEQNPYLIGKDRERLANELGLSETQVKVWFQNKRTKLKKTPQSCLQDSDMMIVDKNSSGPSPPDSCKNDKPSKDPQISFNQLSPDLSLFPMQHWFFAPSSQHDDKNKFCTNFFC